MSALPVQDIFDALHDAGLIVSLKSGGGLIVSPGSRLTPDLRELVKVNKELLVDWLQAANDPVQAAEPVQPQIEDGPKDRPILATPDPNAWRVLAAAYHAHHFACHVCIAAGRGAGYGLRCGAGAALWTSYQNT